MCDSNTTSENATSWLEQINAKKGGRQYPDTKKVIEIFAKFAKDEISPEEAAENVASTLEPLIKSDPTSPRTTLVWSFVCDAIRAEGSNPDVSKRLIRFVEAMSKFEVKDESGETMKDELGEKFWAELPGFAATFSDYGIAVQPSQHLELDEWLAQAAPYKNATTFAAIALSDDKSVPGVSSCLSRCMLESLENSDAEPSVEKRMKVYIPAASIWILIAGRKVFELCSRNAVEGLSVHKWNLYRRKFGEIAGDERFDDSVRAGAKKAADEMGRIFRM